MRARTQPWWPALAVALLAMVAALLTVAAHAADDVAPPAGLVVVDNAALRAAPRDAAPLLVTLWRGEALQLRGARGDWWQVWDVHRERGGFVRASQVMALPPGERAVADLAAQLRLVRQQPGAEALGIGLAAAIVERAGAPWLASAAGADMLDSLVMLQNRLADRVQGASTQQQAAAAHADVAQRYGFPLAVVARADATHRLCPNPQAARLLRAHPAAQAPQLTRAALSLTRGDCLGADLLPSQRQTALQQHADWLDRIDIAALAPVERNRLLLRRASVWASLAFARRDGEGQAGGGRTAAANAFAAWTQVIPAELTDDDATALREAAIRLSPQRWALQPAADTRRVGRITLRAERGGQGETCLVWAADAAAGTARRCSHGQIHLASARPAPDGMTVVLSVQVLDGWTELWRLDAAGQAQVLPPAAEAPGLGAVEWAGWSQGPAGLQVLVARESEAGGRIQRRFEIYGDRWDQPVRWAGEPGILAAFQRGADPGWRSMSTIAR